MEDEMFNLKREIVELSNQNKELLSELHIIKQLVFNQNSFNDQKNFCPICGDLSVFGSYGVNIRTHVQCPTCGSLERHRLLYLLFQKRFSYLLEKTKINLLHFAPEKLFYNYFLEHENINYFPVDIDSNTYEKQNIHIKQEVDMQDIPYNNDTFDFIYNCHVLEHVPDDLKAMGELYRVLKRDGVCITMVPLSNIKETFENPEYNTPELRRKYYGQEDHLRIYGLDFIDKLESVGFNVEKVTVDNLLKSEFDKSLYKVTNELDVIFVCTK